VANRGVAETMYTGQYRVTIDEKLRATMPSRFREKMIENDHITWHLTQGCDGNIAMYNRENWARLTERLSKLPLMDPKVLDLRRVLIGASAELRLDGQGRISLPEYLCDFAGLKKSTEIVIVGMEWFLEIWDKDALNTFYANYRPTLRSYMSELFSGDGSLSGHE
jgi:MraZ protein